MFDKNLLLEEKDILKLLNYFRLDEEGLGPAGDEVPEWQRKRIKKKLKGKIRSTRSWKWKILRLASIAAVFLLAAVIALETTSPVLARNIPLVNSVLQMFSDKFGYQGDYAAYSQLVDKSVTDQGITVTINEALADDTKIILGYTIESNGKIEAKDLCLADIFESTKVNGSNLNGGGATGEFTDDFTYVGSGEFDYLASPIINKLKVDINVKEILGVKGNWDFAFSVSKDELIKNSKVFNPKVKADLPDQVITIDKVVFSPIDTTIFYSGVYKDQSIDQRGSRYSWIAFDDQGVELAPKGASRHGIGPFTGSMQFEKTNGIPHYLTVIPYVHILPKEVKVSLKPNDQKTQVVQTIEIPSESRVLDGNFPLELPQGKLGKLIIRDIANEKGETIIRYTAAGKAPYHQGKALYIKNAAGENVAAKNYDIRRDAAHPDEFTKVFPLLDLSKGYYACTSRFEDEEFLENCQFTIELK
ncbi:hypothetical protein Desor_2708 [Desulfosporosinus orientis DSM 765]|uniref:DUF4179 domain-containing protein n=1 Tax=Desulfosporosinus orientis (strain ATCC 19365 / DSM 765 / NCIMB 8382 / VKM B-1628 / Singapore I) TaxID=768706 RepID=G7WBC1_DESOD|nr:DUF4179 domain-containing protein [Desulfosporosinus orientis]AET68250.1 hypothetical protein Desor_2708 [Desulfosporosinus orientis DSM 765]